jgi:hypothetical protein
MGFEHCVEPAPRAILRCKGDERLLMQIGGHDHVLFGQEMPRRQGAETGEAGKRTMLDSGQVGLVGDQPEIEHAVGNHVAHRRRRVHLQGNDDIRVFLAKMSDGARHQR